MTFKVLAGFGNVPFAHLVINNLTELTVFIFQLTDKHANKQDVQNPYNLLINLVFSSVQQTRTPGSQHFQSRCTVDILTITPQITDEWICLVKLFFISCKDYNKYSTLLILLTVQRSQRNRKHFILFTKLFIKGD